MGHGAPARVSGGQPWSLTGTPAAKWIRRSCSSPAWGRYQYSKLEILPPSLYIRGKANPDRRDKTRPGPEDAEAEPLLSKLQSFPWADLISYGVLDANRRQECGIAPGQVADSFRVAGRGVELLAELEMIAMKYNRLQHPITGALQCCYGRGRRAGRIDTDLTEEAC